MNKKYNFAVNYFVFGNSAKFKTWSNVPFLLAEALVNKGIKINRVNLQAKSAKPYLIFDLLIWQPYRALYKLFTNRISSVSFDYSLWNRLRIQSIVKKQKQGVANIDFFLSFSFAQRTKPESQLVLFHDWNKEWEIEHIHNRKPDYFEKRFIQQEHKVLRSADKIICLFPGYIPYLEQIGIPETKILYLGPHVNIPESEKNNEIDVKKKRERLKILFIGNRRFYQQGLENLLNAIQYMNHLEPEIWIVGFKREDVMTDYAHIKCWGYLDKDNQEERKQFYQLLREATFFVNTTPSWGGFSSCMEAMYFKTPIIISKYDEFVNVFGEEIEFGTYIINQDPQSLANTIVSLFENEMIYNKQAQKAHETVKDYTWDKHAEKIITFIGQDQINR